MQWLTPQQRDRVAEPEFYKLLQKHVSRVLLGAKGFHSDANTWHKSHFLAARRLALLEFVGCELLRAPSKAAKGSARTAQPRIEIDA